MEKRAIDIIVAHASERAQPLIPGEFVTVGAFQLRRTAGHYPSCRVRVITGNCLEHIVRRQNALHGL